MEIKTYFSIIEIDKHKLVFLNNYSNRKLYLNEDRNVFTYVLNTIKSLKYVRRTYNLNTLLTKDIEKNFIKFELEYYRNDSKIIKFTTNIKYLIT